MRLGFGKRIGKFYIGTSKKIDGTWLVIIFPLIIGFYMCYFSVYVMYYMIKGIVLGTYYLSIWLINAFTGKHTTFDNIVNEHRKKHEYSYEVLPKDPDDDFKGFKL